MKLNHIYNEDCLTTMSRLPDNSIDLVITSPPYNKSGYEGFIRKRHSKDSWNGRNIDYDDDSQNDFMIEADYQAQQVEVLNEIHRILKVDGSVFYNHKIRIAQHKASHPIEWLLKTNLTFRQQLVWNRTNSPAVNPIRYLPSTELIFWLTKTPTQPNFSRSKELLFKGEVWEFSAKPNKAHPAPFPEELPTNIMMCVKNKTEDFVVYDPYSGTGTTCKVAADFGFNFIGSETVKRYCDIAEERLNKNTAQLQLL